MGSDLVVFRFRFNIVSFNPRSPRGERHPVGVVHVVVIEFQSTLPTWGATVTNNLNIMYLIVSIHAPHVGSDAMIFVTIFRTNVSIHAPHVGSDLLTLLLQILLFLFQSTLPTWGATDMYIHN